MKKIVLLIMAALLAAGGDALAGRMAVKVAKANVRSGPGADYDILWQVEQYYPLLVQDCKGSWCRFTDVDGDQGWLHKDLLDTEKTVITNADNCNVRSGPGTGNKVVGVVDAGVPFKVLKTSGRWTQVQHVSGFTGWIHASLLW